MIKRPGGEGRYYHGHETAHFCFSDFGLQRTDTVIYHTEKRLSSCAFYEALATTFRSAWNRFCRIVALRFCRICRCIFIFRDGRGQSLQQKVKRIFSAGSSSFFVFQSLIIFNNVLPIRNLYSFHCGVTLPEKKR